MHLMVKWQNAFRRITAYVLAAVLLFGLVPFMPIVPAYAAQSSLEEDVEDDGEANIYLKLDSCASPAIVNNKGVKTGGWIGSFTDNNGDVGYGYCINHDLEAPNYGRGSNLTVKESAMINANIPLKNLYFVSYNGTEKTASFAVGQLNSWVKALFPGQDFAVDWTGLTNEEYRKATQLAMWAVAYGFDAPTLAIEGEYGYKNGVAQSLDNKNAYEYIPKAGNTSASATRVLNCAKGMIAYVTWLTAKGYDLTNNIPSLDNYPMARNDWERAGLYDASSHTLEFNSLSPDGEGTLADAVSQYPDLIHEEGDYYIIDWQAVSATQAAKNLLVSVTSEPSGAVSDWFHNGAEQRLVDNYGIDEALAARFGGNEWYNFYSTPRGENNTSMSDPYGYTKPDPYTNGDIVESTFVMYFQVKIPKSMADQAGSVRIDISGTFTNYKVYLATLPGYEGRLQSFLVGDGLRDMRTSASILWGGANEPPPGEPDDPPPNDPPPPESVLKKQAVDGRLLGGAVFTFKSLENGIEADFVTDVYGSIDVQWTDPSAPYYLPPGTYEVTEKRAPWGYNLDDNGPQQLVLYPNGLMSGPIIFVNTKKPSIIIEKVDAAGQPLAGAYFNVWKDETFLGVIGPTDERGQIVFDGSLVSTDASNDEYAEADYEGLVNGHYTFQEYQAPDGYLLSTEKKGIEVNLSSLPGGDDSLMVGTLVFTNYAWPEIVILKRDAETGEPVPGAVFNVRIDGTDFMSQVVTGPDGTFTITYEEYGAYLAGVDPSPENGWTITVTEVSAPNGYNKDLQEGGTYTLTEQLTLGEKKLEFVFSDTSYRSIKVYKRDAETGWGLSGATFRLHCVSLADGGNAGNVVDRELTTDASGFVIFEDVPNGTYTITEVQAPNGYHNNNEVKTVVVSSDSEKIIEFSFENEPKSGILIRKIDSVTKQPIPNVHFRVTPLAPLTNAAFDVVTNDNGVVILENLPAGTYQIQEVTTVDGYVLNTEPQLVEVDAQHNAYTVIFENNQKNMLNVLKLDAITGEPLAGAVFEVYTAGGTYIATITTGIYGYANLPNLKPGSYVVKEVRAPEGHILDPMPQTFEVKADDSGNVYTLIFCNSPHTNLYLRKYDALTNIGLEGAHFRVWKDNTLIADDVVSDAQGFIHIGKQTAGTFMVQETRAPQGYLVNSQVYSIYLLDGETGTLEIPNYKPGGLAIRKVDAATGAALRGATFELRTIEGTLISRVTTDADGYARWEQLEPGWYNVTEVAAPAGYVLDSVSRTVQVKDFESAEIEWENSQNASISIVKRDKETSVSLAGATFEIRTMRGEVVETVTTAATGVATSGRLSPGWYRVVETVAPEGYLLDQTEHLVEVIADTPVTIDIYDTARKGLTIHKVDAVTKDPLAGAVIEIRTVGNKLVETYTTDASGSITTRPIEPGYYLLVETKAPEGYVLDSTPQIVQLEEGEQTVVTIENYPETVIQIYKTDSSTGNPLRYAEFEILTYNGLSKGFITTDETGWGSSLPLDPGEYIVRETKAPAGYALDASEYRVTVVKGQNAILHITNMPATALHISKVDSVTRQPLAGAEFEIWTDNGHGVESYIGTYVTDEFGMIHTLPLKAGYYMVKETVAPEGYAIVTPEHRVYVRDGVYNQIVIDNVAMGTLIVRKIDSRTGEPIAGAVFKVENADRMDLVGLKETDANGEAIFTGLDEGFYIVTETQAPPGYSISSPNSKTVHVEYGKNNYVDFVDAENGSLVIVLQDKYTDEYLYGGRFTVTRESDQIVIFDGSTDTTGTIVVGNLLPGWYTVTQEFPPDKYTIVDKSAKVEILVGQQQTVYFKDYTAGLVIEKVDSMYPELMLEGARFQVSRDDDGIVIGEYVTGKDGLALVDGLTDGLYTVTELVAPNGYALDAAPQTVHVRGGTTAHATFLDTRLASITIKTVDSATQQPIAGVVVEVWHQNGVLVNTYTSDGTGVIQTDRLAAGYYDLKVVYIPEGYSLAVTEATVQLQDGIETTYKFEFTSKGVLKILSVNNLDQAIAGMRVKITTIEGTNVGEYTTGKDGSVIVSNLAPGWYTITEVKAPDGFVLAEPAEQRVEIKSGTQAVLTFRHGQIYGLQIITTCRQTSEKIEGAVYEIRQLNGAVVGTFTSDASGIAFAQLNPGWYTVTPMSVPAGYTMEDAASRNVEVKADGLTSIEFYVMGMSSIRVKVIDGTTQKGLYNVRLQLKNGNNIIQEYYTNNEGYITLDQAIVNGDYVLEMISAPDGYTVDTIPKSIKVLVSETTEITWAIYRGGGQIQVIIKSADYNATLDKAAGSLLQGAVFEITNADTYQIVGQMISNAQGVAASSGLPIGRYTVKMITAPAYYAVNTDWNPEVRLKINNDVVQTECTVKSVNLKTDITVKSNNSITAGSSMRVDVTAASNGSDVRLDNFYLHIKVPTDAARITTLSTGSWSHAVFYGISYKTNMNDYRTLASNLLSTNTYQYGLSTQSLGLQSGEYVTDVRFEFSAVPAGFKLVKKMCYTQYVLATVYNGYKLISRVELGGQYNTTIVSTDHIDNDNPFSPSGSSVIGNGGNSGSYGGTGNAAVSGNSGQWTTSTGIWTTTVSSSVKYPSTLPKTGY